jgi:hypothetical protein
MGMYCDILAVTPQQAGQLADDPSSIETIEPARSVNLEKAWHGLHYLLTGDPWGGDPPLDFIATGGEPIGDADLGYGPARLLAAKDVRVLAESLAHISDQELWSRFDADDMNVQEIYPMIWDEPEDDLRDEYLMYFRELKAFVAQAANDGLALVLRLV